MADFEWYLNRQGARGQKGEKGDTGEAVSIEVVSDTANEYILKFVSASGETVTPNLRGTLIDTVEEGTYVRYNPETQQVYTSDIEMASTTTIGAVRFTTEEELLDSDSGVVVSPSDMQDYLFDKLKEGKNITISKDETSGNITITGADGGYILPPATQSTLGGIKVGTNLSITADGTLSAEAGGGGTSDYNELTNKPQINSVELTGNKTLDDLDIQRKFNAVNPLSFATSVQSDYINCTIYKENLTYATSEKGYADNSGSAYARVYGTSYEDGISFAPQQGAYFPLNKDYLYINNNANTLLLLGYRVDDKFVPLFTTAGSNVQKVTNIVGNQNIVHIYRERLAPQGFTPDGDIKYCFRVNPETNTLYRIGGAMNSASASVTTLSSEEDISALSKCDTVFMFLDKNITSQPQPYQYLDNAHNVCVYDLGNSFTGITPLAENLDQYNIVFPKDTTTLFNLKASTATTSQLGVVKPDGTSITIDNNGTISAEVPTATSDLTNDSGFITNSVNNLTNYTPTSGLATVATSGSYSDLTNKPSIPEAYTLPTASTTTLGGVKVDGTTITITGDGTISAVGGGTGGTTDYTALNNKPQINSVELTGNKSLVDIGAQAITDNTLTTTNKTIVGAINELVTRITALETQVTSLNSVIDGQIGGNADA